MNITQGKVISAGLNISYQLCEDAGSLPAIVLVHGWGSSFRGNWLDTGGVEVLASVRRVIGLDVRGHGDSDKPHRQDAYSYHNMSQDVIQVLDHLEITGADFMGYSMGACIGASLIGQSPERFNKWILGGIGDETDASLAVLPRIVAGLRAQDDSQSDDPLGLAYREFATADPRNDLESLALSALQIWPEGYPLQLIGAQTNVTNQVLIVNGENDEPYVSTFTPLIQAIPNAIGHVVAGCDHLTLVSDQRFKTTVLDFLSS